MSPMPAVMLSSVYMKSPVPATTDEGVRVLKLNLRGLLTHSRESEKATLAGMKARSFAWLSMFTAPWEIPSLQPAAA